MESVEFQLADSQAALEALVSALPAFVDVSLDTEADSMHHYGVKLCLVQLACNGRHWLVDPLAPDLDLSPLWQVLSGRRILFHGADYDLRMLHGHAGFLPDRIFDTMIAAKFCGEERLGLANLVEKYYGEHLEKGNQKADWTRRPLPPDMLRYAALDTYFLPGLHDILAERLQQEGKLSWVEETCDTLIRSVRETPPEEPDPEPWRIKGSTRLNPRELAVLRSIWYFREGEARSMDRPPFKVMDPELLLAIARAAAAGLELPRLPRNFQGDRLDRFLNCVDDGLDVPREQCPERERRERWQGPQPDSSLVEKVRDIRDRIARTAGIEPTLLANRNQIVQLSLSGKHSSDQPPRERAHLMEWQWDLLGPELSFLH